MSENMSGGDDFDLWQMSSSQRNESMISHNHLRRRVGFDIKQGFGDVSQPNVSMNTSTNGEEKSESAAKISNAITSTVNLLIDHLISHPFVIIRRQCQVNRKSKSYHLTPFTVLPFVIRIQQKQGFTTLWKGIGSVFITKAILISLEAVISELTSFPRDLSSKKLSAEQICQHIVLKSSSFILVTPLLCSSCIETVQSSIASESPGVFDCLKEAFNRISHWKMGRKLPIWLLFGPTLSYHISHYVIYSLVRKSVFHIYKKPNTNESETANWKHQYQEILASFWGQIIADVTLYPLQTIILRLYLQGTRTIIDNVDQTSAVMPIISDYDSLHDCYSTIVKEEGTLGLFKGFGALVFQYTVHYSILKLTKYFIRKFIVNSSENKK